MPRPPAMFSCSSCRLSSEPQDVIKVDVNRMAERQAAAERLIAAQQQFLEDLQLDMDNRPPEAPAKVEGLPAIAPAKVIGWRESSPDRGRQEALRDDRLMVAAAAPVAVEKPRAAAPVLTEEEEAALEREAEQARARVAAEVERRQREEEAELERQRAKEEARLAEQARRAEEERLKLADEFLRAHGFKDVATPKRQCLIRSGYALHVAARLGDPNVTMGLLAKGADPAQKDSSGRTPAQVALQKVNSSRDDRKSYAKVLQVLEQATASKYAGAGA
mmetsp:Transcript_147250/g.373979  ORF Transcript_147250/g.373979 Transcript_147250/m.373979 type:complete len:276 (+) Transcript_147250:3-830(+)